jgi:hypothetical protein
MRPLCCHLYRFERTCCLDFWNMVTDGEITTHVPFFTAHTA